MLHKFANTSQLSNSLIVKNANKNKKNKNYQRNYKKAFKTGYSNAKVKKNLLLVAGLVGGLAGLMYLSSQKGNASSDNLNGYSYKWHHYKLWGSYDHAAIRRGFQVYMQVGAACHGMKYIQFRHLIDVCLTEDEAKDLAAEYTYMGGPDDEGEMFERPGVLFDILPPPYENEEQARYMNDGALPPDLSVVVKARHGEENYIFNLLTGYRDPPAGVILGENMYYNPYFPGSQIAMPPPLQNDMVEYEDGTDASISQMAKDVTTFLAWAGTPELDERHLLGLKSTSLFGFLTVITLYWKRFIFAPVKNRQVRFLRKTEKALKNRTKNF